VRRIVYFLVALPIGIVLIVLSVANRQPATLSLDPFSAEAPALSLTWPFFAFLFASLLLGLVIGAVATWFGQGRYRAEARRNRAEAVKWRGEAEAQRRRSDELAANLAASQAALPALRSGDRAA